MRLIFYGKIAESLGREVEITVPPEGCTVAALRAEIAERYPHAAESILSPSIRAGVDDTLAGEDQKVSDNQVVEFFPPLSGG